MKAFITGKSGFVGTYLSRYLMDSGIIVVDATMVNKKPVNILKRDCFCDMEKPDVIIHLAAKTSIPESTSDPYDTYHTNIMGTLNVLDYAKENGIKKLINLSTYVYGQPLYLPIDENHPINPHSPYNKSKLFAENLCEAYSNDYDIDAVSLRPFNIYGLIPNQKSFLPIVLKQIRNGGRVFLNSKNTIRDFLFVDDLNCLILKIINDMPRGYNVYNVGYGRGYSLEEIISILGKLVKCKIDIGYDDTIRPNDIREMVADISLVSKTFNWRPTINIEEGLRRMVLSSL